MGNTTICQCWARKEPEEPPFPLLSVDLVNGGSRAPQNQIEHGMRPVKLHGAPRRCPDDHRLFAFAPPRAGHSCNGCGQLCVPGVTLWACRKCEFDLCSPCRGNEIIRCPFGVWAMPVDRHSLAIGFGPESCPLAVPDFVNRKGATGVFEDFLCAVARLSPNGSGTRMPEDMLQVRDRYVATFAPYSVEVFVCQRGEPDNAAPHLPQGSQSEPPVPLLSQSGASLVRHADEEPAQEPEEGEPEDERFNVPSASSSTRIVKEPEEASVLRVKIPLVPPRQWLTFVDREEAPDYIVENACALQAVPLEAPPALAHPMDQVPDSELNSLREENERLVALLGGQVAASSSTSRSASLLLDDSKAVAAPSLASGRARPVAVSSEPATPASVALLSSSSANGSRRQQPRQRTHLS